MQWEGKKLNAFGCNCDVDVRRTLIINSATYNMGTRTAFLVGPKKTAENLDQDGQ
jgi:hypothetical protein